MEAAHHHSHGRGVVPEALEELHQVLRHQGVPRDQVSKIPLLLLIRQLALQKQVCALNEVAGATGRWIRQLLNRVPSRAKVSMVVWAGLYCEMLVDAFSDGCVRSRLVNSNVPSVEQHAVLAVYVCDLALAGRRAVEPRVECADAVPARCRRVRFKQVRAVSCTRVPLRDLTGYGMH